MVEVPAHNATIIHQIHTLQEQVLTTTAAGRQPGPAMPACTVQEAVASHARLGPTVLLGQLHVPFAHKGLIVQVDPSHARHV